VVQPAGHHLIIRIPAQLQVVKKCLCVQHTAEKNVENVILLHINIVKVLLV
jgi:hypothetical protein